MSTRVRVCGWIALGCLAVAPLAAAQERTVREIVDVTVRDGPHARAIRAQSEAVRGEQFARLAYPNPDVTFSREGAGFTEFLQIGQTLPLFGARAALARAGVAATGAAEAERDARLWLLRADAAAAAARLVVEEARLAAAEAHAREIARLIGILRTREREGEGSRFDRLRAEQELWDARQAVTAASLALTDARSTLAVLLPPDVVVTGVTDALYTPHELPPVSQLVARASSTRAELRSLEQAARHASLEADAARRARRPQPTLFGGLKRADNDEGREEGAVIGVSVSLPLLDTGAREAGRWMGHRARVEADRAFVAQQIRMDITRAADALALRQAAAAEDAQASGDELAEIAELAYQEGEVGILELLDAYRTASRARMRSLDVRFDARLAQIALERAVGDVLWP